jgi:hypothetical protein
MAADAFSLWPGGEVADDMAEPSVRANFRPCGHRKKLRIGRESVDRACGQVQNLPESSSTAQQCLTMIGKLAAPPGAMGRWGLPLGVRAGAIALLEGGTTTLPTCASALSLFSALDFGWEGAGKGTGLTTLTSPPSNLIFSHLRGLPRACAAQHFSSLKLLIHRKNYSQ